MEINVENYLSEDQMNHIAKTVFAEKITESIESMINNSEKYGIGLFNNILNIVVNKYATKISKEYDERIMGEVEKEINRTESTDKDYNDTFRQRIICSLHNHADEIIKDKKDDLEPILYEKIIAACDELIFAEILNKVFYRLQLDSIIKKVVEESKKEE